MILLKVFSTVSTKLIIFPDVYVRVKVVKMIRFKQIKKENKKGKFGLKKKSKFSNLFMQVSTIQSFVPICISIVPIYVRGVNSFSQ